MVLLYLLFLVNNRTVKIIVKYFDLAFSFRAVRIRKKLNVTLL